MKYDDYALDLGFKKIGDVYYMEANGFIVYLKDWQYSMLKIPSFYIPLNQPLTKDVLKKMEKYALDNVVAAYSLSNDADTLIVSLADGNKKKESVQAIIKKQIESTTLGLIEEGYLKMSKCPLCGKETEYMLFGDNYCPMHIECRNDYINKLKDNLKKEDGFNKKYLLAIILAVIGSLVGIIPALILSITNYDYYFGGMLAFTPILAIIGYLVSKVPNKKWIKITIGLIVMLTILSFLGFAIPFMAYGKGLALDKYMFSGEWIGTRRLLFGVLLSFGGFGGVKMLDKYKKNSNDELKKFEDQLN